MADHLLEDEHARRALPRDFDPTREGAEAHAHGDEVDRRGFLKCMAWAGTGLVWTLSGGILSSCTLGQAAERGTGPGTADFTFAQVSDSHIGFKNVPNTDVVGTFQQSVARLQALAKAPAFLLHTGDISHLSKPDQFDAVEQILKGAKL